MNQNLTKQLLKWFKNEFIPIFIGGIFMTLSLVFTYYFIVGTIIILFGGQHLFAFVIWSFIITSIMYFLALFLTQLWEDKTVGIVDKIKPTLVYMGLLAMITYISITKGHIVILSIIYIFMFIGSITGHCLNYYNRAKISRTINTSNRKQ